MTEDPSVNGKPHDPMRDPAAEPARDVPTVPTPEAESADMEAMLGRALEPVLQRLGSIEQTQNEMSGRLDIIEQHTPTALEHDAAAATVAPATATDAVASAIDAHATEATEATVAPATATAAAATKSTTKGNGNGLTVKQLLAVLGAFAVIYAAGFGFVGYQIADLSRRIDTQGTEIRAEVRESEARINARIDMLVDRVETLEERVARIEVAVAEILVRLAAVEQQLTYADARLARVEGALDLPPLPQPSLDTSDA